MKEKPSIRPGTPMAGARPESVGWYDADYARHYTEHALGAPYTLYKNSLLARMIAEMGFQHVLDIGCNVSALIRRRGSLRFQLEEYGVGYRGVDVSSAYFDPSTAQSFNLLPEEMYVDVNHDVAAIEQLPYPDGSISAIVCADVLEHIDDPSQALAEMARVLKPDTGRIFLVLPSMYKLDRFDFDHIRRRRASTHVNKSSLYRWASLWPAARLELDEDSCRALGIASGLSYLTWIDHRFAPRRPTVQSTEYQVPLSHLHRETKRILAARDEVLDTEIVRSGLDASFVALLRDGDLPGVYRQLSEIVQTHGHLGTKEHRVIEAFFRLLQSRVPSSERVGLVSWSFLHDPHPKLTLGNSVLLVLKRSGNDPFLPIELL